MQLAAATFSATATRTPASQAQAAFDRLVGAWDKVTEIADETADAPGVGEAITAAQEDASKGVEILEALAKSKDLPADQDPSDALSSGREAVTLLTKLEKDSGSFAADVKNAQFHLSTAVSTLGQQFHL